MNATDELASDIRPHADAIVGPAAVEASGTAALGVQQEVWPYLAALAFVATDCRMVVLFPSKDACVLSWRRYKWANSTTEAVAGQ